MKVLHVNAGLEKGGGLSHIVNLLTEANRQDADFELLTLADGPVAKAAKKAGIKTTILGAQSRYDLTVLKRLAKFINNGNFDIVHTHGARANLFVSMIKKQIKAKWIITVHSDPLKDFEGRGMIGNIFTKLNIMALKKADGIFAITQNFSDLLVDLNKKLTFKKAVSFAAGSDEIMKIKYVPDFKDLLKKPSFEVMKFVAFHPDGPKVFNHIREEIKKIGDLIVTASSSTNIEINNIKAQKGIALMDYAKLQGYQPNEVMAIGDNLNDESMIRMAGIGVAMETPHLKSKNC